MQAVEPKLAAVRPHLIVQDIRRSMEFYTRHLGFESSGVMEMEGKPVHGEVFRGETVLMFGPRDMADGTGPWQAEPGAKLGSGVVFYIGVSDGIDAYYQQVRASGAKVVEEIADQFWGDRTFMIEDPDGYIVCFSQHVRDFPQDLASNLKPA